MDSTELEARQPVRSATPGRPRAPRPIRPPARSAGFAPRLRCLASLAAVAAAFVAPAPSALARPQPVTFRTPYQAEFIGPDEGFPENSCSGIAPAPDGTLWLGTFRGLIRYNGHSFARWAPAAVPHLDRTGIVSMARDSRGRTWFSSQRGLVLHDGKTWHRWTNHPAWGDDRDFVRSYAEHPRAGLAFGRFSGAVVGYDGTKFLPLPTPAGEGGALCAYDDLGTLYAVRGGRAQMLTGETWQPLELPEGLGALGFLQDPSGHAVLVADRALLHLRDRTIVSRTALKSPVTRFWMGSFDSDGHLWLASVEAGAYRISPDGSVLHLRGPESFPSAGGVRVVYPLRHGNVLVGSGVGGFTRLRPARFRYLGRPDAIGEREIVSLAGLPDGSVLLAPNGAELHRFDGVTPTIPVIPAIGQPSSTHVRSLLRTRDGTVWCGLAVGGLHRWENQRLVPAPGTPFPADESLHSLFEDAAGRLWLGGERTVVVRRPDGDTRFDLPGRPGPVFFADLPGGAVALARNHEVHVVRPNQAPTALTRFPEGHRAASLLGDSAGRLWIGTLGHGLHVFHDGQLRAIQPGGDFPSIGAHALLLDPAGFLWFGGDRRIVRIQPDALWQLALDPAAPVPFQVFDTDDGLRNLEFPFSVQPSSTVDASGRIWFALIRGATAIDPARLVLETQPPAIVFDSLSYLPAGARQPLTIPLSGAEQPVRLPAGSRALRIEFAGLDFSAPAKQRFRVRLDGIIQSSEPQREREIGFFDVPPGDHIVYLEASGSDGAWNRTGAQLALHVTPYFWETLWFRLLAAGALFGLVGGSAWFVSQRRVRTVQTALAREQRLAAAQARLALVLENTSDCVLFLDASGRLFYVNRAGRALVGLPPHSDLSATPASRLFVPSARTRLESAALPAALAHGTWSGELELAHAAGNPLPVSAVVVAHRAPDGSLDFAAVIARDISAARRHSAAQEALRRLATALTASLQPEPLGRAVAEACREVFRHDAFFLVLVDPDSGLGRAAYLEDTADGADGPAAFPPFTRPFLPSMEPVLRGQSLVVQRTGEADDPTPASVVFGRWGYSERSSRSLLFVPIVRDGGTIGIISVQSYTAGRYDDQDLARLRALADQCGAAIARMHVELRLRENEERLRLAMQSARLGCWEIDTDSGTLIATREAEALYGRPLGDAPAALAAHLKDNHAAEMRQLLDDLIGGRIHALGHTQCLVLPDGTERWLEIKAHRLGAHAHARIVGITADITDRVRAENERTRLEEQLRQSQKLEAVGTLAGGIAHDFNNILTAVLGNVELARLDLPPDSPTHDFLQRIHESSVRARDLVRRLLTSTRPKAGRRSLTALPSVIHEVVNLLRATIPATTEIRSSFAPNVPPVHADATEIHQALLNLGTNASHALGHRPGWIEFALEAVLVRDRASAPHTDLSPGPYVRIRVRDNGTGIPAALLPRIFDPFFTTKAPGQGTGLGLSVVHGVMRANGGAVTVASTPGEGTTFELYFPAASGPLPPEPTTVAARSVPAARYSGRILFVDDEEPLVAVARRALAAAGFEVTACSRPSEALARFQADPHAFDLVLTDFAMPGMSGTALTEHLLRIRPDLPVVMTSGYIPAEEATAARRAGIRALHDKIEAFADLPRLVAPHLRPSP